MKRKIKIQFWWIIWVLFLEFVYRYFIIGNIFNINSLYVVMFSVPWIILFSFLSSLFSEKINKIITIFLMSFLSFLTLAQIVYYNFYDSVFSFFSLTIGTGQVMHFWQMILDVIIGIWYIFLIVLVSYILFIIFHNKLFCFKRINLVHSLINLIVLVIVALIMVFCFYKDKDTYSLNKLFFKTHAPMLK